MTDPTSPQDLTPRLPPKLGRTPNPWIAVPVVVATTLGWLIGGAVARASCANPLAGECTSSELAFSIVGAIVGLIGTLVVAVLAVRSIAEWRALQPDRENHDRLEPEADEETPT